MCRKTCCIHRAAGVVVIWNYYSPGRSQLEMMKRTHIFSRYFILVAWIYFRNYKTYSQYKVLHQGRTCLSSIVNTVAANGLAVQGPRASAILIAFVNIHCKQADFLPVMPANVPHFICLLVCEINITFKMLLVQLKPQMFIGIQINAILVGCLVVWLVGNRARLSHSAKLWKLCKMAVSWGKRLCRSLPTFPIEMSTTIFDSLSKNHVIAVK